MAGRARLVSNVKRVFQLVHLIQRRAKRPAFIHFKSLFVVSTFIAPDILTPQGVQRVPVRFGIASDVRNLRSWRTGRGHPLPAAAGDSIEYAKLASKRWSYYARRGEIAKSLSDLQSRTCSELPNETGFLLVAESIWENTPPTLAIA